MSQRKLNVITFNNPYPPNYGGVIDCYYKIVALSQLKIEIYLHIFYDERIDVSNLEKYCKAIYTYKRNTSFLRHLSFLPFSVMSRMSQKLVFNLNKIETPILFESLRTCHALTKIKQRSKVVVRCHNIEHRYSMGLFKSEASVILKLAHFIESFKQKRFEKSLNKADILFAISKYEKEYFSQNYNPKSVYLPPFHGHQLIKSEIGFGNYALYHGDLSISDNRRSALFLIDVFKALDKHLVIASSTRVHKIEKNIRNYSNISFKEISDDKHLELLIRKAHVNIVYSFQRSGTKLKVFNALYNGRHCIVNDNVVDDENILQLCHISNSLNDLRVTIKEIFTRTFVLNSKREEVLNKYNAINNAKIIVKELYD